MANEEKILQELESLKEEVKKLKEKIEILEKGSSSSRIPYADILTERKKPLAERYFKEEIELSIGTKWLPRLGMIALVIGIGLFLKYAFDNNWVGPTGRIVLGLIGGVCLLMIGEYFERKGYSLYSKIFTGGGFLVLYLSLWAAHSLYLMIDKATCFILMCFVTLISSLFSLRYNSIVVAFYALIGGFVTPFLVGPSEFPALSDFIFVFIYFALLNIGILFLSFFKKWRTLEFAGFICTAIVYLIFYASNSDFLPFWVLFSFLTLYFLIFLFVSFFYNILHQQPTSSQDVLLLLSNTLFYYAFSYVLIKPDYFHLMGLFTFSLSFLYLALAYLAFYFNSKDKYLTSILLGICAVFVGVGILQQLKQHWITIFWSLEALVLVWVGFKMKDHPYQGFPTRILGIIFLFPPLIRLLAIEGELSLSTFTPILNRRVFSGLVYIFVLYQIARLYSQHEEEIAEEEKFVFPAATGLINFVFLYLMTREIWDYFDAKIEAVREEAFRHPLSKPEESEIYLPTLSRPELEKIESLTLQRKMWVSVSWTIYSALVTAIGIIKKIKILRWIGIGLFGIVVFKVFFVDLSFLEGFPRIFSFIILGMLLLGVGFFYNKYKDKIREFI